MSRSRSPKTATHSTCSQLELKLCVLLLEIRLGLMKATVPGLHITSIPPPASSHSFFRPCRSTLYFQVWPMPLGQSWGSSAVRAIFQQFLLNLKLWVQHLMCEMQTFPSGNDTYFLFSVSSIFHRKLPRHIYHLETCRSRCPSSSCRT